jgi:2'-5' RNA ligase
LSLRAFTALELPPELQQQLARLQDDLKAAVPPRSVRWVRAEGIHLTLKFYGDVAPERLALLRAGLDRAAAASAPMQLSVEGAGVFPNVSRPSVIWAGVGGELEALGRLQAAVEAEAIALGFKPEDRPNKPHLTLGRVNPEARAGQPQALQAALARARGKRLGSFRPRHLSLMNSELRAGGSVYKQLYTTALAAA